MIPKRSANWLKPLSPNWLPKIIKHQIKVKAENIGFDLFGVTDCSTPAHLEHYRLWLAEGCHGEMGYLERHLPLKADPLTLLPEARSILVVGLSYYYPEPSSPDFQVARYARGDDYHGFMKQMLEELAQAIRQLEPALIWRSFVDSGPLMERDLAQRAGLGWIGKNTCLINPQAGSFLLLGCLLSNLELEPDKPFESFHCGSCTRCLEACPTQAIKAPHWLDARECISYWTIEQRETIPAELRPAFGNWAFGCDICQQVCPWNLRFARISEQAEFYPRQWLQSASLADLLLLSAHDFELKIAPRSPLKRPKYRGFMRNLAVVAGNSGQKELVPVLQQARELHAQDAMLCEHLDWALERLA